MSGLEALLPGADWAFLDGSSAGQVIAAIEAASPERQAELLAHQPPTLLDGLDVEFRMRLELGQMAYQGRYEFGYVPSPEVDRTSGLSLVEDLEWRLIEGDRDAELTRGIAGVVALIRSNEP